MIVDFAALRLEAALSPLSSRAEKYLQFLKSLSPHINDLFAQRHPLTNWIQNPIQELS